MAESSSSTTLLPSDVSNNNNNNNPKGGTDPSSNEASTITSALIFMDSSSGQQQQQQPHNVTPTAINDSISSTSMYIDAASSFLMSPSPIKAAASVAAGTTKSNNNNNNNDSILDYSTAPNMLLSPMEENMARKVETNDLFLLLDNTDDEQGINTSTNNQKNNTSIVSSDGVEATTTDSSFLVLVPPSNVAAATAVTTGSPTRSVPVSPNVSAASAAAAAEGDVGPNVVTPDKQQQLLHSSSLQQQLVMDDYVNSELNVSVDRQNATTTSPTQPAAAADAAAAATADASQTTASLSAEALAALSFVSVTSSSSSPPGLVDTTPMSSGTTNSAGPSPSASPSQSSWFGNLWSSGRGLLSLSTTQGDNDNAEIVEHERCMMDEDQLEERLQQHFASSPVLAANGQPQPNLRIRTDAMYLGDVVSVISGQAGGPGTITRTNSARSIKTDDFPMTNDISAAAAAGDVDERHSSYRLVAATAAAVGAALNTTPQKSNVSSLSPGKTQQSDDDAPAATSRDGQHDGNDNDLKSPWSSSQVDTSATSSSSSGSQWWRNRNKWFYIWIAIYFLVAIAVVLCLVFLLPNKDNSNTSTVTTTTTDASTSSNVRDIPPVSGRGDNTVVPTISPLVPSQPSSNATTSAPSPTVVLTVPLPEEPTMDPSILDVVVDTDEPGTIVDGEPTMMPTFVANVPAVPVPVGGGGADDGSTPFPTFAIDPATRLGSLLSIFSSVVDMGLLQDPSTPQGQAVKWLVNAPANVYNTPVTQEDGTTIAVAENAYLIERFALLVLQYSMLGNTTNTTNRHRGLRRGNDHDNAMRSRRLTMAHSDSDTCLWEGVTCYPEPSSSSESTWSRVEKIDWAGRSLSGFFPNEIGIFKKLYHLDLSENSLQGPLPDGLFDVVDLEYLYLQDNLFTGTLSERFADLKYLENVYLGRNRFTGPFPKGLGSPGLSASSARKMRYLSLYQNFLSGPIPAGLNLRRLYYLDLSNNRFSGSLPAEWANEAYGLNEIRLLYLENNEFSGEIPSTWPRMGNGRVETLHLGNNQLTGTVPGGYNPRNFLQSLEVQGNRLSGPIPEDICSLIVFLPPDGELVNLRADCDMCTCEFLCGPNECG